MVYLFHIMDLAVIADQRNRHTCPPDCIEEQRQGHRHPAADANDIRAEDQHQRSDKRNTASDIPPGIPLRGNFIHPFLRRDIRQHRIIKDQAQLITGLGNTEYCQKRQPFAGKRHRHTADHSHQEGADKQRLLIIFCVRHRSEDRSQDRHQDRGQRQGKAQKRGGIAIGKIVCGRNVFKVNRNDRGTEHCERGIAHIIQNPLFFQARHFSSHR